MRLRMQKDGLYGSQVSLSGIGLLGWLVSCSPMEPPPLLEDGVAASGTLPPLPGPGSPAALTVVDGKVFYDEFREVGRFDTRMDESGNPGTQVSHDGTTHNYLGLYEATVRIYEIDPIENAHQNCALQELLYELTVQADGSFGVAFDDTDPCMVEPNGLPDLAIEVSLEYCDPDRCFAVHEDDDDSGGAERPRGRSMRCGTRQRTRRIRPSCPPATRCRRCTSRPRATT